MKARLTSSSLILSAALTLATAGGVGATTPSTVWLLQKPDASAWCSYADQSLWKVEIDRFSSPKVGKAVISRGRWRLLEITETAESGDWTITNRLTRASKGRSTLGRSFYILSDDSKVEETFSISPFGRVRTARSAASLTTGRPKSVGSIMMPQNSVAGDLRDFAVIRKLIARPQRNRSCS